jgi:hypothetical protein
MKSLISLLAVIACLVTAVPAIADVIYLKDSDVATLRYFLPAPQVRSYLYAEKSTLPDSDVYRVLPSFLTNVLPNPPIRARYVTDGTNVYLIDNDRRIIDAAALY